MNDNILKLREETGMGIMECKKALEESNGDFSKALEIVMKSGIIRAENKKERKTGAGLLHSYIHNNRVGVLVELRCETDFVTKSDPFNELIREIAIQIAALNPENVDSLLESLYVKDETIKISDLIKQTIGKLGENIKVERFARFEI